MMSSVKTVKPAAPAMTDTDMDDELIKTWHVPAHELQDVRETIKRRAVKWNGVVGAAAVASWWKLPSAWGSIANARYIVKLIELLKLRPPRTKPAQPLKLALTFAVLTEDRRLDLRRKFQRILADPDNPVSIAVQRAAGLDTDMLGVTSVTVGDNWWTTRLVQEGDKDVKAALGSQASLATGS